MCSAESKCSPLASTSACPAWNTNDWMCFADNQTCTSAGCSWSPPPPQQQFASGLVAFAPGPAQSAMAPAPFASGPAPFSQEPGPSGQQNVMGHESQCNLLANVSMHPPVTLASLCSAMVASCMDTCTQGIYAQPSHCSTLSPSQGGEMMIMCMD